jgi:hypothetical protein
MAERFDLIKKTSFEAKLTRLSVGQMGIDDDEDEPALRLGFDDGNADQKALSHLYKAKRVRVTIEAIDE